MIEIGCINVTYNDSEGVSQELPYVEFTGKKPMGDPADYTQDQLNRLYSSNTLVSEFIPFGTKIIHLSDADGVFRDDNGDELTGISRISSPKFWHHYRTDVNRDYKFVRERLKGYAEVSDTVWYNQYDDEDRQILAEYKVTSVERRTEALGDDSNAAMTEFNEASIACREHRFSAVKSLILNNVDEADHFAVMTALDSSGVEAPYIKHGIDGIGFGDLHPGIWNWIECTPNTPFEDGGAMPGFKTLSIGLVGSETIEHLAESIINIGYYGNYKFRW